MKAGERAMRSQRGYVTRFERRRYSYRYSHFASLERRMKATEKPLEPEQTMRVDNHSASAAMRTTPSIG